MFDKKRKPRSNLVHACMQTTAGATAGFVKVCVMHPLDSIKTRLQLQIETSQILSQHKLYYNGMFDCAGKMIKAEGLFSLYKGLLPSILVETPRRAVKFTTFEQLKPFFMFGSEKPTLLTFSLAGLGAGVMEAVLVNPFEMVKVTLQANHNRFAEMPSTFAVTKQIIAEQGFGSRGLNRGLSATICRQGVHNMFYFGFYNSMKNIVPEHPESLMELGRIFTLSFVSGVLGSILNIPFDLAKVRIQGPQPQPNIVKYRSTAQTIILVYREEGFRALFHGIVPKVMRLAPKGAIMMIVYEYVYEKLDDHL